jgi:hypothetical protein
MLSQTVQEWITAPDQAALAILDMSMDRWQLD